jgi:hypothetical protein
MEKHLARNSTKLDALILGAATEAQETYIAMTAEWLSHGPESFLQMEVARKIFKDGFYVYPDASDKKVLHAMGPNPGRPPEDLRKRFDLSVWNKTTDTLRAVIEIKAAYAYAPVAKDKEKIARRFQLGKPPRDGYLLVYSETRGKTGNQKLQDKFTKWSKRLDWKLVGVATEMATEYDWAWGFGLSKKPK